MVEIKLLKDIKVIQETLSRIGIACQNSRILYPSAYLITLEGKQYIAHFKELFRYINDDAFDNMLESDFERLNSICFLIAKWGLITCINNIEPHQIKVDCIRFEDKKNYIIKDKIKIRNVKIKLE